MYYNNVNLCTMLGNKIHSFIHISNRLRKIIAEIAQVNTPKLVKQANNYVLLIIKSIEPLKSVQHGVYCCSTPQ